MPLAKPAFSPLLVAPNISLVVDLKIQENFMINDLVSKNETGNRSHYCPFQLPGSGFSISPTYITLNQNTITQNDRKSTKQPTEHFDIVFK